MGVPQGSPMLLTRRRLGQLDVAFQDREERAGGLDDRLVAEKIGFFDPARAFLVEVFGQGQGGVQPGEGVPADLRRFWVRTVA